MAFTAATQLGCHEQVILPGYEKWASNFNRTKGPILLGHALPENFEIYTAETWKNYFWASKLAKVMAKYL